jgi:type IV secretory pathway VirB2 component (pilin)
MKVKVTRILQLAAPLVPLLAGVAHAAGAGASPMAGVFTTVEGWLTGDIAEWLGICAIVGLGALIWFAHDYGHIFGYTFKGILGIAVVVFAITEYTTAFGGGATIGGTSILAYASSLTTIMVSAAVYSLSAIVIGKYRKSAVPA